MARTCSARQQALTYMYCTRKWWCCRPRWCRQPQAARAERLTVAVVTVDVGGTVYRTTQQTLTFESEEKFINRDEPSSNPSARRP